MDNIFDQFDATPAAGSGGSGGSGNVFDQFDAPAAPAPAISQGNATFDRLVAAITNRESSGNPNAVSKQGARGKMQVMPDTFKDYAQPGEDFNNDEHRTAVGIRKLAADFQHYGGDIEKTAAAYLGGRGAVRADGSIRDDVRDAEGTTPLAYAKQIAAKLGSAGGVNRYGYPEPTGRDLKVVRTLGPTKAKPDEGVTAGDYAKSFGAGVMSGAGMIAQGGGELLARGINAATGSDITAVNPLQGAIDWLNNSRSDAAKKAEGESQIKGNVFDPDTWDFGKNPSAKGIALQGLNTIGQFAPNLAIALVTAGLSMPAQAAIGATVGGVQALGGGAGEEREKYLKMTPAELEADSELYRTLRMRGVAHGEAQKAVAEAAALGGGLGNALPSAGEGAFENVLIGLLTRGKLKLPGFGLGAAGRVLTGAVGGAATGGTEEAVEQMGQNLGVRAAVGSKRDIGDDTLGQFVMGAIGEGALGGGGGLVSKPVGSTGKVPAGPAGDVPIGDVAGPVQAPVDYHPDQIKEAVAFGEKRLRELEAEAKGAPDQKVKADDGQEVTVPGKPARILTDAEKAEIAFLKKNAGDGATIAKAYGIQPRPAEPKPGDLTVLPGASGDGQESVAPKAPEQRYGSIEAHLGNATVFHTERGATLQGHFALVDADQLNASHDTALQVNPAYPAELQPRDRGRAAYEIHLANLLARLNPDQLGENPLASHGAPIIGEDGVVESGNGRVIVLRRAYDRGAPAASAYRAWLAQNATKFGLATGTIAGMKAPVLVRVRTTPVDRAEFARQANAESVARMSPAEVAKMDAQRLTHLEDFVPSENGDIFVPENMPFIRRFIAQLPATEQNEMVTGDGQLSQSGLARIRNAVLAKAYNGDNGLARMVESVDNNVRNITAALMRVAPRVAQVREAIAAGALHDLDITADLLRAVEDFSKLRAKKISVGAWLAQASFFTEGKPSVEAIDLLRFLDENSRSPTIIVEFVNRYLSAVEAAGNPNQASIFGEAETPMRRELIAATRKGMGDEATQASQGQPDLAGLPEGTKPPAEPDRGGNEPAGASSESPGAEPVEPGAASEQPGDTGGAGESTPSVEPPAAETPMQQEVKKVEAKTKKPRAPKPPKVEEAPKAAPEAPKSEPMLIVATVGYGSKNTVFTADAAAAARALLRKKLGQINAGIDPEVVQAGLTLAGYHVEAGARKFAAFTKAMLDDLGEVVRPYLKSWYLAVRNYPGFDNAGMNSEAEIELMEKVEKPVAAAKAKTLEDVAQDFGINEVAIIRALAGRPDSDALEITELMDANSAIEQTPNIKALAADWTKRQKDAADSIPMVKDQGAKLGDTVEWAGMGGKGRGKVLAVAADGALTVQHGDGKQVLNADARVKITKVEVAPAPSVAQIEGLPADAVVETMRTPAAEVNGQSETAVAESPVDAAAHEAATSPQNDKTASPKGPHAGALETPFAWADKVIEREQGESLMIPQDVQDAVKAMPRDSVVVLIEKSPVRGERTSLMVSNGDGSLTFLGRAKDFANRGAVIAAAKDRREKDAASAARGAALRDDLRAKAEALGIAEGVRWNGASAYVTGKTGLTTFDWARIVSYDKGTGAIVVESYKRGMRAPARFTTNVESRFFDNYPKPDQSGDAAEKVVAPKSRMAQEVEAVEKRNAAVKAAQAKIDDVGEKIGGARKDTSTSTGARSKRAASDEPAWRRDFTIGEIVGSSNTDDHGMWSLTDRKTTDWYGHPKQIGQFKTKAEAEAAIPLAAVVRKHSVQLASVAKDEPKAWEIVRRVGDRKRVRVVEQTFPSQLAAMQYMADHAVDILETKTNFGEEILPMPETVTRVGKARRDGDVNGENFKDTYGFRGVEFGNWNNQDERQQVMNHAFDALADLAEILNIPPKAIGLNGELALAFGARGQGLSGARAHYERDYGVINLTKMSGAGTLAHEWFHSLDHYFGRQDGKASSEREANDRGDSVFKTGSVENDMASHSFSYKSGLRPELQAAYRSLIETMFKKAEAYVEDSKRADEFVGRTREDLKGQLDALRAELASQKDPHYWKRNNKPASAEQLAEFDGIAEKLLAGEFLDTTWQLAPAKGEKDSLRARMRSSRWTNDALEQISGIYKAVRGRSGFDATNQSGVLDSLRGYMRRYSERLKMLADAQAATEKTRMVPTKFAMEAKSIDQGRASDYWATPHEMAARAFQSYVEDKVREQGGQSDFLTFGTNKVVLTPWGWKQPYPAGAERVAIDAAFDKFVGELRTKETDKGVMMFSRKRIDSTDPLIRAWSDIARDDDAFRYADTNAKDPKAIAAAIDPGLIVTPTREHSSNVEKMWIVRDPKAKGDSPLESGEAMLKHYRDGSVELDASVFGEGKAGSRLYHLAATYAHNNGLVFNGDRIGISDVAVRRRTENMLSSALRYGTTEHIAPGPELTDPTRTNENAPTDFDTLTTATVRPIDWKPGDDAHNLRELLLTSHANVTNAIPEMKGVRYNFDTQRFETSDGNVFPDSEFLRLARSDAGRAAAAGVGTLKRTAVTAAVLQGRDAGDVAADGLRGRQSDRLDAALGKILYSRVKDSSAASGDAKARVAAVQRQLDPVLSRWKNAPPVRVVATTDDMPVGPQIREMRAENEIRGWFDGKTAWLVAGNLKTERAVLETLFHEAAGHYGLRGLLGDGLNPILKETFLLNESAIRKMVAADYTHLDLSQESHRLMAAEEFLAHAAQAHPTDSTYTRARKALQRVIAMLRDFLRSLGVNLKLSDADLQGIIGKARRFVESGVSDGVAYGSVGAFGRQGMSRMKAEIARATGQQPESFSRVSAAAADEWQRATQDGYRETAKRVLGWIDSKFDPIGDLADKTEYLRQRYEALGNVSKADEIAKGIRNTMSEATAEDKQAAYDYLTTPGATSAAIKDGKIRAHAEMTKATIESVGDALVERGLLSREAREAHRGGYLPRLYLRHMLEASDWKALGSGKKPSQMGYLKKRKDIPDDVRKVILGEITDPAFLSAMGVARPMRDMALLDWLHQISRNEDWILPASVVEFEGRRVSAYWLKDEAAQLRKQARYYAQPEADKAKALADRMEAAADDALGEMAGDHADFRQIPNTARYGRLRGMFVRKEIYDDVMGVQDFQPANPNWAQSLLGYGGAGTKLTQLWKLSKVALNPPGQVRNFLSNAVMLQLSGVPLHRVPQRMMEAIRDISANGKYYQIAKRYGVTESTFSAQEIGRMRRDLIELELQDGKLNPVMRAFKQMHRLAAIVGDAAGDLYQKSETIFKLAKIIDAMERENMPEADAALEAHKWMFDYSLVPQSIRYLRSAPIGIPFATYMFKVAPRMLEVALAHPQRLLPWAALFYALPMLIASGFDVDDDDLDKLKKALPDFLQEKGHTMFLPYRDELGRMQVIDLGYFFPWTQWSELASHLAGAGASTVKGEMPTGELGKAVQSAGVFGGPLADIIVALKTGQDPFTKRDIWDKRDPAGRQAADMLNYVWSMAAPPFLTSRGVLSPTGLIDQRYGGKAVQAATGTTDRYGDPRATAEQAALALLGMNLYAVDPDNSRAQNVNRLLFEIKDVERRAVQQLKDRALSPEKRQDVVLEYQAEIQRRYAKMQEYLGEAEIHPNLRTRRPEAVAQ